MAGENEYHAPTSWLPGVAITVLSWGTVGLITGATFLAYVVPARLNRIDNVQEQIIKEDAIMRVDITKLQDAVQSLRDRVTRLESR